MGNRTPGLPTGAPLTVSITEVDIPSTHALLAFQPFLYTAANLTQQKAMSVAGKNGTGIPNGKSTSTSTFLHMIFIQY